MIPNFKKLSVLKLLSCITFVTALIFVTFMQWGCNNPFSSSSNNPIVQKVTINGVVYEESLNLGGYVVSGKTSDCPSDLVLESTVNGKNVVGIKDSAFEDSTSLISIEIPNSVTYIGSDAFEGCTSLTNVKIPNSVTYIGDYVFYNCVSLAYNESNGIKYLGNDENPYLYLASPKSTIATSASIEQGCKFIGSYAFSGCSLLTNLQIPNSVISICASAFENCSSLTSVNFNGTKNEWNNIDKSSSWDYSSAISQIVCSDETINV